MLTWFKDEKSGESGQGMVEYGLILVLVSIAAITGLTAIGTALEGKFQEINGKLGGTKDEEGANLTPGAPDKSNEQSEGETNTGG